ncbi:MAG: hypothetical protein JNK08_10415 [Sediminibacterium sp.]|nr:hypothetical protein [Sediminibacterium sp.]
MKKILLILLIAGVLHDPAAAQKIKTLPDNAPSAFATELNRLLADARFDFKNTIDQIKPGSEDDLLSTYYSKVQLPLADSSYMEDALDDFLEDFHQFYAVFGNYPTKESAKTNFNKIINYIEKGKYNEGLLQKQPVKENEKSVQQLWSLKSNKANNSATKVELSLVERKIWPANSSAPSLVWIIELCVFEDGGF